MLWRAAKGECLWRAAKANAFGGLGFRVQGLGFRVQQHLDLRFDVAQRFAFKPPLHVFCVLQSTYIK